MGKENLLTERDLLVLSACTSVLFTKDFSKVQQFMDDTLGTTLYLHEFALQDVYDKCKEVLKDEYIKIINKMIAQTQETKMKTVSCTNEDDTWFHPFKD